MQFYFLCVLIFTGQILVLQLRINSMEMKMKEYEMELTELRASKKISQQTKHSLRSKSARQRTRALDVSSDSGKFDQKILKPY